MICPRCSVAEISPLTGACELCGYVPGGAVAVDHPDATDELARRELAHQFRVDVLLGQGEGSAVYLAREFDSDRHVVLKVVQREPGRRDLDDRFREAVNAVAALEHPHLVPVIRHGSTDSLFWYSTPRVRGRSLRNLLRTMGHLDFKATLRLITQVASALDYMHRRGLVHGAVKPENVLVDDEGWAHVCDTMVARVLHAPAPTPAAPAAPPTPPAPPESDRSAGDRVTPAGGAESKRRPTEPGAPAPRTSPAEGTPPPRASTSGGALQPPRPAHVAPEDRGTNAIAPPADQYALAALVRECVGDVSGLPIQVQHALRRASAERAIDRFPSVLDFVAALESDVALTDTRPSHRPSAGPAVLMVPNWQPPPRDRSGLIKWGAAGAAVLVIGLGAWYALVRANGSRMEVQAPTPALRLRLDSIRRADSLLLQPPGSTTAAPIDLRRRGQGPSGRATSEPGRRPERPASRPAATRPPTSGPTAPPAAPSATAAPGRLSVSAVPWGQLFVDGQAMGNTPKVRISLAPGPHTIRIVRDGYEPYERSVRIEADQELRLTEIRLVERRP